MTKQHKKKGILPLAFLTLGIVYGDIGTSPLYTMQAVFSTSTGIPVTPENILGTVSAIIWALIIIVSFKYVMLMLRADNRGEGGILALLSMVLTVTTKGSRKYRTLFFLGICGAALFMADSVITPAITVLGALEGLHQIPFLEHYHFRSSVIAIFILFGLFYVQKGGTAKVGNYFSYVMVVWFLMIGYFGFLQVATQPSILRALDPLLAIQFLFGDGKLLLVVLSGIVLAITGVEALYADMGHLGRNPIRLAWTAFVLPSLALNYMGQGVLLLNDPSSIKHPFYSLFPDTLILPAVIIATLAAIIASQAVISGTFSMTRQAIQLGLLPRLNIIHKSLDLIGQIYMPFVNWMLFFLVFMAIVLFRTSEHLASAYGLSVTLTMATTTILTYQVIRKHWRVPTWLAICATTFFLVGDSLFVLSSMSKIWTGGWFALILAGLFMMLVITWQQGKAIMARVMRSEAFYLEPYIKNLMARKNFAKVKRTAIYLVENPDSVPSALVDNLKHNMVLHERNIFLTVEFTNASTVPVENRLDIKKIADNFWRIKVRYGFMEHPNIMSIMALIKEHGLPIDTEKTSYFMSQQAIVSTEIYGMARWREEIFSWMYRNSNSIFEYFNIPPSHVVILGSRIQI